MAEEIIIEETPKPEVIIRFDSKEDALEALQAISHTLASMLTWAAEVGPMNGIEKTAQLLDLISQSLINALRED